jgi:drug/metabolite transporter (DMT)-like permease
MWFSVAAIKYTDVTVAATLTATSPLFVLPLAALMLKERISPRVVAGAVVAVLGVVVLVMEGI